MLSFRARGILSVGLVLCGVAQVACGFEQESPRPQPAPDTYEIIQGRMTIDAAEETLTGARVSRTFFSSVGEHPIIGRLFVDDDHKPGSTQVVILHNALWKDRFAARPDIVGRTVRMDGRDVTVIAVMPPTFNAPSGAMFWVPRP